jgi:hypothetical protein
MKTLLGLAALGLVGMASQGAAQEEKWESLFDGTTLSGWEWLDLGAKGSSKWEVQDGAICGSGAQSMLFSPAGHYKNFKLRAEIKINDKGNSGMYFRCAKKATFSDGYEAQIDSTHADPIRTGSIYGMVHIYKQYVKPDTWFTYQIECQDRQWRGRDVVAIRVSINDELLYEYFDFNHTYTGGYFAFQQHDPGSRVCIRKVEVRELP